MNDNADTAPPAKTNISTGGVIAALVPHNFDEMQRLAIALSSAGEMIPSHFRGNMAMTLAAIMRGMDVGLAPMQALSSIAVINGRATIWGDAMPALMQRAGHHIDVEIEGTGDDLCAVATLTRGDTGKKIVRRFSMADAKRAGLAGKTGPWTQYPQRMVSHRARAWAIRDGAADALMGMHIADEATNETAIGPDAARDVNPRRGGVVYRDPDPVDEILEAELLDEMAALKQRDPAAYEARLAAAETAAIASFDRGE